MFSLCKGKLIAPSKIFLTRCMFQFDALFE